VVGVVEMVVKVVRAASVELADEEEMAPTLL